MFLAGAMGAPTILRAAAERRGVGWNEVEKMLARGDVQGRLTKDDLPTPALLVDLDAFEENVTRMASFLKARNRAFRPHAKTHKCPEIAKALIQAGAVGACTAKISEAEVLARHGVSGLLLTSAMVGRHRIERAVQLVRSRPDTIFSADDAQNVRDLNEAAGAAKLKLNLAIDLRVGGRTGIQPGEPALALAQTISSFPNVTLAGLQAYAGQAAHTVGFENRKKVSEEVMGQAVETRRLFEGKGIACPLLTGGSTGTYNIDSAIDGVTEIQPGSFMFMDLDYSRIGGEDGPVYKDFKNSLFVLTTVISKPSDDMAIVDGGLKAFSTDKPIMPQAVNVAGMQYAWGGDEHGRLSLAGASAPVNLGDRIEFVIPHCDPSVNLYDRLFCLRGNRVEAVWPIAARGMSQ